MINKRAVAANMLINLIGQTLVGIIGLVTLPVTVRNLGHENYGLLALAMTLFGSMWLLDMGMGRATTKFIAEFLSSKKDGLICSLFWTSALIQLVIGIILASVLVFFSSIVIKKMLIPENLLSEANTTVAILVFSIPIVLVSSAFRGALEGAQRFDVVNIVKVSLNLSTYLIPLIGSTRAATISQIVLMMFLARMLACFGYLYFCIKILPDLFVLSRFRLFSIRTLILFSGWVALSNVASGLISHVDRLFISILVGVSSVTFYTVPLEVLNGVMIVPVSITAVVYPAFSGLCGFGDKLVIPLYSTTVKYVLLITGALVAVLVVFSRSFLVSWQGAVIAENSSLVLQILSVGVLVNTLGWVPSALLMAQGRPDQVAKINLLQTPINISAAYFLTSRYGVVGAALAFLFRSLIESAALFMISFYHVDGLWNRVAKDIIRCCLVLLGFASLMSFCVWQIKIFAKLQIVLLVGSFIFFGCSAWFFVIDLQLRKEILARVKLVLKI